jgi:hypothetical protein
VICEETAAVFSGKNTSKTPFVIGKCSHVQQVNYKNISRFRTINMNWPRSKHEQLTNLHLEHRQDYHCFQFVRLSNLCILCGIHRQD